MLFVFIGSAAFVAVFGAGVMVTLHRRPLEPVRPVPVVSTNIRLLRDEREVREAAPRTCAHERLNARAAARRAKHFHDARTWLRRG